VGRGGGGVLDAARGGQQQQPGALVHRRHHGHAHGRSRRRIGEEQARNAANLDWLERTFVAARTYKAATVVLLMQADMWDGTPTDGFTDTIQRIAHLALTYGKPVLLIEGDSHIYKVDNPSPPAIPSTASPRQCPT
jgi:hypothetical protein